MSLAHTTAAPNEFAVVVVQRNGRHDHFTVLAESSCDAISQVMDSHPDAHRIQAHLSPRAALQKPKTPCMTLGLCQGDGRCEGCTQPGPWQSISTLRAAPLAARSRLSAWLRRLTGRAS
jgi:hypothetical protein